MPSKSLENKSVTFFFLLYVALFSLVSCERSRDSGKDKETTAAHSQDSQAAPDHGDKPSKETTNISTRAKYLKAQIEKYKEWGGHSALPQRVVTAKTFAKLRREIGPEDSPALILLLQDDAEDVRSIAASLLECVDPNAQSEIKKQLSKESNVERQNRLRDALIQIRVIREGGTSCK